MEAPSPPAVIDIRIARIEQLFQTFDPSPFRERDLDPDASAFIVDWAREQHRRQPIEIHLNVKDSGPQCDAPEDVSTAIRGYFRHRAELIEGELREMFRFGRIYLAIGLMILVAALVSADFLANRFGESPTLSLIAESLVILGWVANWRPLEIFLYEWRPLRRDARLFQRLAAARVRIKG